MGYQLLSQSRKLDKWGGPNKSGGEGEIGKFFEKNKRRDAY